MTDILKQFGINGPLLIVQGINFALLLLVLHHFLYKPLITFLDERREKIAKSLQRAKDVEEAYNRTQEEREAILAKARTRAEQIVQQAVSEARARADEVLKDTNAQQKRIIADARVQLEAERADMMASVEGQLADMVVQATAKLLEREFSEKDEERLLTEAANVLKQV